MTNKAMPAAVLANAVPEALVQTRYPEPFASMVRGRVKRRLGDFFDLQGFGVNLVRIAPGAASSVPHHHSAEDEFIYVLSGTLILMTDNTETVLQEGMCAGFKAGNGITHQIRNQSDAEAIFLEVGSRLESDTVEYPFDDLALQQTEDGWVFTHKDGSPY